MAMINANDLKAKMLALRNKLEAKGAEEPDAVASSAKLGEARLTEVDNTHVQVINRIAELRAALEQMHPQMATILVEVHSTLKQYPDTVHLLSDTERSVIVQACFKHSGVVIATSNRKAGKTADGTKKLKDVNVDDI